MRLLAYYIVFVLVGMVMAYLYWSSRRAVVGRREFAGVSRVFLFCFLGRMAAGGASDLIIRGFPLLANFGTGTAPGGFPHFETTQSVSKYGGTS